MAKPSSVRLIGGQKGSGFGASLWARMGVGGGIEAPFSEGPFGARGAGTASVRPPGDETAGLQEQVSGPKPGIISAVAEKFFGKRK